MATDLSAITEAEILTSVMAPERATLTADAANSLLGLQFSEQQVQRMHELADKNNAGAMSNAERAEMESYVRVGNFLSLVQSKARISLKRTPNS